MEQAENITRYTPIIAPIRNLLTLLRKRWIWFGFCRIILLWIAILLTSTTFICLIAGIFHISPSFRLILLILWIISLSSGPIFLIFKILCQPGELVLASLVEKKSEMKHNFIINALMLERDDHWNGESGFVKKIISESSRQADNIDPKTVLPTNELKRPAVITSASIIICSLILLASHQRISNGFHALTHQPGQLNPSSHSGINQNQQNLFLRQLPLHITAHYPKYLTLGSKQLTDAGGSITIPEGTELEFIIKKIASISAIRIQTQSQKTIPFQSGRLHRARWLPTQNDSYAVLAQLDNNLTRWPEDESKYWNLKIIPDNPPKIRIPDPGEDTSLPPGAKLKILIIAEDDHAVSEVKILLAGKTIKTTKPQKQKYTLTAELTLPENLTPETTIEYWATATDNRKLPGKNQQTSASKKYKIKIIEKSKYQKLSASANELLTEKLRKILKLQIRTRTKTIKDEFISIAEDQKKIAADLKKLSAHSPEVQKIIKNLADTTAPQAAALALSLPKNKNHLLDLQQQIILTIESILSMLDDSGNLKDEQESKTQASRPADIQTMQELSELMGKFIDQHALAIKSAQNLANKSPQDFSIDDKNSLKELQQLEEQWEKFLQQAVNDMNKVADQDFSASVARDELVEIQGQVELAKDALKKQSVHMAVTAEQVGLELAEELVHNLERWLENKPDRLKWDLEEPPEPVDVPLAELPEELEDIIGELIEEEEDFYDEIEDVTSSWADSLDVGAGWQVGDGPISNYSAKGITGNILPNKNEIAGRSGEGRTGRSSGEFVEKTAVGKGGRRTPTRLTKDDFQSGQIEDLSKDAPGGATGGGKVSGKGAEGLAGPTPKNMLPDMAGMRKKQAILISKTRMAYLQAKKHNWGNFQLDRIMKMMNRNVKDIDSGAYRSLLARKHILLNTMKTGKSLIQSKFQLDRPAQKLPKLLQAYIENTGRNEIPPHLKRLVNEYYRRLSE